MSNIAQEAKELLAGSQIMFDKKVESLTEDNYMEFKAWNQRLIDKIGVDKYLDIHISLSNSEKIRNLNYICDPIQHAATHKKMQEKAAKIMAEAQDRSVFSRILK